MKTIVKKTSLRPWQKSIKRKPYLQGYPLYPAREDIYNNYQKEDDINPEDISKTKESKKHNRIGTSNQKDFKANLSGSDLDIPGSELDDEQEFIGCEDEENNYYSIGGDNHNDLEEDNDE